jgi:pimeloyl-ACP methyl ester carboxylesterase
MRTAHVDDIEIEYDAIGEGEPVLMIHGSNLATGLVPLAAQLAPSFRVIRYHRRGMAGSGGRDSLSGVEQQAADALRLLDALGIPSAHLLGYSYGAVIALEAALSAPARVRSLALLEPILTEVPSAKEFMAGMEPLMSRYDAGDGTGATEATFAGLAGPGWRELIATAGPDAFELAVRDAEIFYRFEEPAMSNWVLDETRAAAVQVPVLSVMGTRSGQFFEEGRELLHQRFAHCTDADIPDANHLLHLQAPEAIAAAWSAQQALSTSRQAKAPSSRSA